MIHERDERAVNHAADAAFPQGVTASLIVWCVCYFDRATGVFLCWVPLWAPRGTIRPPARDGCLGPVVAPCSPRLREPR